MRINKQVVNYVTQKVNELADKRRKPLVGELDRLYAEDNKAMAGYKEDLEKLGKRCHDEIIMLLKKHGLKLKYPERATGMFWCLDEHCYSEYFIVQNEAEKRQARGNEIHTELERIRSEVNRKVDEIIARLSLGGTAGDLDQMLAAVSF